MKHLRLIATSALLVTLAVVSTNVQAALDDKLYPGVVCQRTAGGTLGFFGGTIDNLSSTSELAVLCPFVRDTAFISSGNMKVFDRNTTLDVTCDLRYEFTNVSGVFFFSNSQHSTGFASGVQQVNFGSVSGGEVYYASCSVPRTENGNVSHIASFRLSESD